MALEGAPPRWTRVAAIVLPLLSGGVRVYWARRSRLLRERENDAADGAADAAPAFSERFEPFLASFALNMATNFAMGFTLAWGLGFNAVPHLPLLRLPAPAPWLRALGAALAATGLAAFVSSHISLAAHWNPTLRLRPQHALVSSGMYAWVRHPMYSALLAFGSGFSLLTGSVSVVAPAALSVLLLFVRIPREEQMMLDRFGAEYTRYSRRTWRLVPFVF